MPARRLLESATLTGARALGLGDELGSLTPGKRAEIVRVDVPSAVDDVEEFLVSGVHACHRLGRRKANQELGIRN